jgi:hypothetical protein
MIGDAHEVTSYQLYKMTCYLQLQSLCAVVHAQVNAEKREARHNSREQLAAKYNIDTTRFKATGTGAGVT